MNFLVQYNEVDTNYLYKSTLGRINFLKNINYNNNFVKPRLKISIIFKNVLEPDFVKIYDDVLFFWLISNKTGKISNLKQTLRRGVRYYRFVFSLIIDNNDRYFKFLDFLHYDLFKFIGKNNLRIFFDSINVCFIELNNVYGFSNVKFSDNFFVNGTRHEIYVSFLSKCHDKYFLSSLFFLSLFKLVKNKK